MSVSNLPHLSMFTFISDTCHEFDRLPSNRVTTPSELLILEFQDCSSAQTGGWLS